MHYIDYGLTQIEKNKEEVDEILLSIQKENKIDQESMDNEKKSIEEEKNKK